MSNRLRLTTILCAVLGVSGMLAACDDQEDASQNGEENGGAAGESPATAGKQTGGSSSGSAGKAGGGAAGKAGGAGTGGEDTAGAGGVAGAGGEPLIGGAGGEPSIGGAGGASGAAGAAGAGGGGAELEYVCGSSTLSEKLCSALASVTCPDPTICAECIPYREGDLELFAECPACAHHQEAIYQCAIDAYEGGDASAGIECFGAADYNDACAASLNAANACNDYKNVNGCPAVWPIP